MGYPSATVRWLATLTAMTVAAFLSLSQTAAATFKVSPTSVDLERSAGGAALGTIDVRLGREGGYRFRTVVQEITQRPDGTQVYSPASSSRLSASSWVSVTPSSFGGDPDRTQPIQYRVSVPPNAEPGDHLASLTVQRLAKATKATASSIEAVSVRLTIRVRGAVRPEAKIVALDVPSIADGGPISVATTIRNSGNVTLDFEHGDPGQVTILDGGDRKVALPFEGSLFPGQTRVFQSRWEDPPLFGSFDAEAAIHTGGREARSKEGFLVIPWRQIGALVLIVVAVALLALGWRRRRWGY